ncbi:hypothetical protein QT990_19450 [Microcoleus sp. T3_B1]|uniref:hypothetical protein n=1 Tax=Microcoleus sp. T3_B1 TaxID=3055425 RepID=UPI002FD40123
MCDCDAVLLIDASPPRTQTGASHLCSPPLEIGARSQESGVRRKEEEGRRKEEEGRRKKEGAIISVFTNMRCSHTD